MLFTHEVWDTCCSICDYDRSRSPSIYFHNVEGLVQPYVVATDVDSTNLKKKTAANF